MSNNSEYTLHDNTGAEQYQFHIGDAIAKVEYRKKGNTIYLVHTEVPEVLEGKGIAAKLVEAVLKDVEAKKMRMVVLCPYITVYLKKHPEWNRLLANDA